MKNSIFIPKKINVGYQNRSDTYTGKLAYVIYYDEKGKLRKEVSWNSWRNKEIPNEEFDNVPTEGFVLNKKVGDYSNGWDHRQAYCRVYDPRNFEFEITIENLLYILAHTNSIKGKGLEGEFIYGWDGKDLVLMPCDSPDYKEIQKFNQVVHNNECVKAKDLIIGATYLDKNNQEYVYMGKFDYYSYGYRWLEDGEYKYSKNLSDVPIDNHTARYSWQRYVPCSSIDYLYGKYFWFAYKQYEYEFINDQRVKGNKYKWRFVQFKNISANKFITCSDNKCTFEYADIYELMEQECNFSPRDYDNVKYIPYSFEDFKQCLEKRYPSDYELKNRLYFSDGHCEYEVSLDKKYYKHTGLYKVKSCKYHNCCELTIDEENDCINRFDIAKTSKSYWSYWHWYESTEIAPMTIEELYEKLKPHYREIYLANGHLYDKENYYGNEE